MNNRYPKYLLHRFKEKFNIQFVIYKYINAHQHTCLNVISKFKYNLEI